MSNELYVAKTILSQIDMADGSARMAWGFHQAVGSDKETTLVKYDHNDKVEDIYKDFGCRGWIQFEVNGMKYKGRVYVGLNALDYYDVILLNITQHKDHTFSTEKVGEANDIFCEDLMATIDHLIERQIMIVTVKSRSVEALENFDYRDRLVIEIDGKSAFSVSDGEPEDSNLGRDFSNCFSIGKLMQKAFEAGKRGENFVLEHEDMEDE